MFKSVAIVLIEGTSIHSQCVMQLRFHEETNEFSKKGTFLTRRAQHFLPVARVERALDNSLYLSGLEDNQTPAMPL